MSSGPVTDKRLRFTLNSLHLLLFVAQLYCKSINIASMFLLPAVHHLSLRLHVALAFSPLLMVCRSPGGPGCHLDPLRLNLITRGIVFMEPHHHHPPPTCAHIPGYCCWGWTGCDQHGTDWRSEIKLMQVRVKLHLVKMCLKKRRPNVFWQFFLWLGDDEFICRILEVLVLVGWECHRTVKRPHSV